MNYIDLFCGAGGFSLGFDRQGFENVFSLDKESSFCDTYRYNFPKHSLIEKDIKFLTEIEINSLVGNKSIDVVIGGPPCQGFSLAGNIGRKFIDDPRNSLFKEFVRVVSIIKPRFFVMENVARLYNHNKGGTKQDIIRSFNKLGYEVEAKILNSVDYGVPQIRRRIIFIGALSSKILFPPKTVDKYLTVADAISHFPQLKYGECSNEIPNHKAMNHTQQMLKKMSYIADGGDRSQIPEALRPKSGDVRKYIKYNSSKPSFCITGDMRKVFHYSQNRALTVRELAALQSFPDNFTFLGTSSSQQQQVGNSVPPKMAEAIAKIIIKMAK